MNDIKNEIDELIQGLHTLPYYQQYLEIKNAQLQDAEYLKLKSDLSAAKKQIKFLVDQPEKLQILLEKARQLNAEFDGHPLNVNYRIYREKLVELIDPLFCMF